MYPVDLKLMLDLGECNGVMSCSFQSSDLKLGQLASTTGGLVEFSCKVTLPTKLLIKVNNKNYRTDTKIDSNNNIVSNKYIELKQLWLGGIELNSQILPQICSYTHNNSPSQHFTTFWDHNGNIEIEFFDKHFIQYHLHYNNKL